MGRQSRRGVTACLSLVSDTGDPEHVRSLPVLVGGPITSAEGSPMLARGPLVSVEEPQMSVRGSPYQLRACIGHCLTVTAKGLRVGQEPSYNIQRTYFVGHNISYIGWRTSYVGQKTS